MSGTIFLLLVYSPVESANAVRQAAAKAGAGNLGNYDSCSFSVRGTGRFRPLEGADPYTGETGTVAEVAEERIEMFVTKAHLSPVLKAITEVHPYEEPAIEVLETLDYKTLL